MTHLCEKCGRTCECGSHDNCGTCGDCQQEEDNMTEKTKGHTEECLRISNARSESHEDAGECICCWHSSLVDEKEMHISLNIAQQKEIQHLGKVNDALVGACDKTLKELRKLRDKSPKEWDSIVNPELCKAWDLMKEALKLAGVK